MFKYIVVTKMFVSKSWTILENVFSDSKNKNLSYVKLFKNFILLTILSSLLFFFAVKLDFLNHKKIMHLQPTAKTAKFNIKKYPF